MNIRTFENSLFPSKQRWAYSLDNVHNDSRLVSEEKREQFIAAANQLYPGWDTAQAAPRIGVLSLMLPVGCNATCPGICYTNIEHWRKDPEHLTIDQIRNLFDQFANLGGRVVRIVGDGEPALYRSFVELSRAAADLNLSLVVFSNGITMPDEVVDEFCRGHLYFYFKLWSEDPVLQDKMVAPRSPYRYVDGAVGSAPRPFYQLYEINQNRVGFQIMVSSMNIEHVRVILAGPKQSVPMLIEPFIPEGAGKDNHSLLAQAPDIPTTKSCEKPIRAGYLAVVNSKGLLQSGTFVPEGAISVKNGNLAEIWERSFTTDDLFFTARYSNCCFCEMMRQRQQS